jgi:hypothetical protein
LQRYAAVRPATVTVWIDGRRADAVCPVLIPLPHSAAMLLGAAIDKVGLYVRA